MPTPPALKTQVAAGLGINVGVEVVLLGPVGVSRIETLKILHQVGAIEHAATQIACHHGHPGATRQPTGVAHGIFAAPSSPIGQRGASDDDRSKEFGTSRSCHHQLPASLAVADNHGLAFGFGVALKHFL